MSLLSCDCYNNIIRIRIRIFTVAINILILIILKTVKCMYYTINVTRHCAIKYSN